jgi:hypothetical protein
MPTIFSGRPLSSAAIATLRGGAAALIVISAALNLRLRWRRRPAA